MLRRAKYNKKNYYGWIFVFTSLVLMATFLIYPIIDSLILSTKSCKGIVCEPNGLGNIKRMLNDEVFHKAFKNTFIFFIVQVPIMLTMALMLASMLNNKKLKYRGFFRTAIFLPTVTSLVAYSVLFKMMFGYEGLINQFLMFIQLVNEPIPWLTNAFWAKVTIIIALLWRWTGYNMVFYLAALQNVSSEVYEAAEVDGASKIQQFFKITVPLLKPIILFTAIMSTIGTLQLFDEPMNLTGGGPSNATLTISQYIYNQSFVYVPNFGYAATLSYVIVFIVAILTIIQFKVAGDE
ncbi:carbohydrate ABC transporter permease [Haloplasma contractile]|uniref:Binding-protein-dependent transport systems inner membrane component n=1 Tax=Haloplasma contractile SSD-17B TaxID=1033810 RepID=U2FPY5_9MOLU|nr:sugar ABC transporter permease [Haloplasma contractile]ERJ13104.1 Binding-protein-dependent transport systems inner membrane component [Haloplasma contractile SSD-17B]